MNTIITEKQQEEYFFMSYAIRGILLFKNKINNTYRCTQDILKNIDDIEDNQDIIGLGFDIENKEILNENFFSFIDYQEIIIEIEKKFFQKKIIIACKIEELLDNTVIQFLNKYSNIELVVNFYDFFFQKSIMKDNQIIIEELQKIKIFNSIIPKIKISFIPYIYHQEINEKLIQSFQKIFFNSQFYFYYYNNDNLKHKKEYLKYLDNFSFIQNIEDIFETENIVIKKILNIKLKKYFFENDIILEYNNKKIDFLEEIEDNFLFNFKIKRNNQIIYISDCEITRREFLNQIIFKNTVSINSIEPIIDIIQYNGDKAIIFLFSQNLDIINEKIYRLLPEEKNNINLLPLNYKENKKLDFNFLSQELKKYREKTKKIITEIWVPYTTYWYILNNSEKTLENFQIENLIIIRSF